MHKDAKKIARRIDDASSAKKWDVTIVQTSVVTGISAKTEQEAVRKARDDASWSDHVVDVQTIASAS